MADYHVGDGEITGEIYAGVLAKNGISWRYRSIVTDEAICAVRDHLINRANESKTNRFSYEWTREDGKKIVLSIAIK